MALSFPESSSIPVGEEYVHTDGTITTLYEWTGTHWKAKIRDQELSTLDLRYLNLTDSTAPADPADPDREVKTGSIQANITFNGGYEIEARPRIENIVP